MSTTQITEYITTTNLQNALETLVRRMIDVALKNPGKTGIIAASSDLIKEIIQEIRSQLVERGLAFSPYFDKFIFGPPHLPSTLILLGIEQITHPDIVRYNHQFFGMLNPGRDFPYDGDRQLHVLATSTKHLDKHTIIVDTVKF